MVDDTLLIAFVEGLLVLLQPPAVLCQIGLKDVSAQTPRKAIRIDYVVAPVPSDKNKQLCWRVLTALPLWRKRVDYLLRQQVTCETVHSAVEQVRVHVAGREMTHRYRRRSAWARGLTTPRARATGSRRWRKL